MSEDFGGTSKMQTVLVTGGSGFVGSWAIAALLQQGYRVQTTVRSLTREPEVRASIARQADPADRLTFFAADLLKDEGWDRAAEGAQFILHIASPMPVYEYKNQDVIRPAREGTLRVLRAGAKAGVERVVMTSSVVTALSSETNGEHSTDETIWTDLTAKGMNDDQARGLNGYTRAKTLAEQDAWEFVRQEKGAMTLSTILAGSIQGPVLGKDFSGSIELVSRLLTGKVPALPRLGFSTVDVRDLVDLHLKAMTLPTAAGQRFIGTGDFLWLADMARILRDNLGVRASKVPTRLAPDFLVRLSGLFDSDAREVAPSLGRRREFSTAKAQKLLGWHARPASEAILDGAESLLVLGLV